MNNDPGCDKSAAGGDEQVVNRLLFEKRTDGLDGSYGETAVMEDINFILRFQPLGEKKCARTDHNRVLRGNPESDAGKGDFPNLFRPDLHPGENLPQTRFACDKAYDPIAVFQLFDPDRAIRGEHRRSFSQAPAASPGP